MTFPLIFEDSTSPLYTSNDGRLVVSSDHGTPKVWQMLDRDNGNAVVLETYERLIADAYIAGYDLATDATKSSEASPRPDSGEAA